VRSISGSFGGIGSLSFSPDSLLLAAGDGDGKVRVWNIWDGSPAWSQRAAGDMTSVTFAPDGTLASWSSDEDTIDLWRTADGTLQRSLPGHQWSHYNVAFSPDGTLVASGGDMDPVVKLLSVADGGVVRTLVGHTGRVRTVAFSSDGSLLASSGDDATIRLWRVADGTVLDTLTGHAETVWKLALAPNGTLASASTDGTLRLWRLVDGVLLRTYATQLGGSQSVELSPDGSLFAFESNGQVILVRNPFPAITRQPTRLTRFDGQAATFAVTATGEGPLTYQWRRNGTSLAGTTNATLTLANLLLADDGAYTVEVSNPLGTIVSRAVDLTVLPCPAGPGSLDVSFDPTAVGERPGLDGGLPGVRAMLLEPDSRFLIGGRFAAVNGTVRRHLARLEQNGTVDPSFHPGLGLDGEVTAMARQADGSIVVAGLFTAADGQSHGFVARLDRHGKVDPGFRVTLAGATWMTVTFPTGVAVQSDGHVWVCGSFTEVNGVPCSKVARLNPDGTLDQSFYLDDVAPQGNEWVDRVFVQDDDRVILGGCWTNSACSLVRLQPDATLDSSFVHPSATVSDAGSPGHVDDLATHFDGRIAIVGGFRAVNGVARHGVAWLQPNGTLDTSFDPGSGPEDSNARRVVIEPDGRTVIGGWFTRVQGTERLGFARFNTDGTLDPVFDPGPAIGHTGRPNINAVIRQSDGRYLVGADDWFLEATNCVLRLDPDGRRDPSLQVALQLEPNEVRTAAVQPDGCVLVAGAFTNLNGVARPGLARLGRDGLLDPAFSPVVDLSLEVWAIAVQSDRRILVGGLATSTNGGPAVIRLESDGRRDAGFSGPSVSGPLGLVETIVLQPDGRILVATNSMVSGAVVRLRPDGVWDSLWQAPLGTGGFYPETTTLFLQPDGRVILAGRWQGVGGVPRPGIARLNNDAIASRLVAGRLTPRGYFQFGVQGYAGVRYVLEASEDLKDWEPLIALIHPGGQLEVFDPDARNFPQRFYRARIEP